MPENFLFDSLIRYIGQTVTIFTMSGGLSGAGFTGTLASIDGCTVRLITGIGAPPSCPVGSACTGGVVGNNWGGGWGGGLCSRGGFTNWMGSITEIPIDRIVSFTHNSIC